MYINQILEGEEQKQKVRYYDAEPPALAFMVFDGEEENSYYGAIKEGIEKKEIDEKKEKQRRLRSLKRHIRYDDYFGTLANVLSLIQQNNSRCVKEIEKYNKALERIADDLVYLQDNYRVEKK